MDTLKWPRETLPFPKYLYDSPKEPIIGVKRGETTGKVWRCSDAGCTGFRFEAVFNREEEGKVESMVIGPCSTVVHLRADGQFECS